MQPLGTEARLVVPRAVGLLRVLELAAVRPRVGVVEAAVDGWQDESPSGGPEPTTEAPRRCWPGSPSVGLGGQGPLRGSLWGTARGPPRECGARAARSAPWPRVGRSRALTAEVGGPPVHAHALGQAGLGVGGHRIAQALAVTAGVTPARVAHAGLVVGQVVHLREPALSARQLPRGQARGPRAGGPPGCGRRRRSGC